MARVVFNDVSELKKHIIKKIKTSNVTLKEISEGIGIGKNTLYIFLYRDSNITICNLEAICNYFKIDFCFEVKENE